MASSKTETQIQWSSSDSTTITTGSTATSDAFSIGSGVFGAAISCKADNQGTPASGDIIHVYLMATNGDTDNTGGSDEYDTAGHAIYLGKIDTNVEDPAQRTFVIPSMFKGGKIYAENDAASSVILYCRFIAQDSGI